MEPIAIVGMSCRFPRARQPEALWELLHTGGNAIGEVPPDRWDMNAYYAAVPEQGKMCTRWGGFLDQVDKFDAPFFGIPTREARYMDPQQRVVLEVAWEALERAGIAPTSLAGSRTGVFIGVSNYDYNRLLCRDPASMDAYSSTGTILAITANRLSYLLNLRGPSVAVDTACSSSLVSTHLACQSLRVGESSLALAGGVNLILSPEVTIILSQGGLMSPDGSCKAFDETANGYVRSEGCGVLILKRLSDAERDRNNVIALILGSAVNQDGRTNGLTAPSATAQQDVIRQALRAAETRPDQLSYVEAHGSGTPLGDIIEARALRAVLLEGRSANDSCAIGSVKTNIGHTESAAGIAGLIKVVLALQHEVIPANLHLKKLNPHIRFQNGPLFVPTKPHPWPSGGARRRAGVSSFGIGGTNAHVIVEETRKQTSAPSPPRRALKLLPLSAKSENSLQQMVKTYRSFLAERPEIPTADLCFTASHGRSHFPHRIVLSDDSTEHLREQLSALCTGNALKEICSRHSPPRSKQSVGFLCTGQGVDYVGYGSQLYETEPAFQEAFSRCDELLGKRLEQSLVSLLAPEAAVGSVDSLHASLLAFGFQYALAELWRSWGIMPAAVLGFGVGELVAACIAGVLTLDDSLNMTADIIGIADCLPHEASQASLAAEQMNQDPAREPRTLNSAAAGVSYLSPLGNSMLEAFHKIASETKVFAPGLDLISSITCDTADGKILVTAQHLWKLLFDAPRPIAAFECLSKRDIDVFLELGPGSSLGESGVKSLPNGAYVLLSSIRREDGCDQLTESLKEMYLCGVDIDWSAYYRGCTHSVIPLPTYPFEAKRFWFDDVD